MTRLKLTNVVKRFGSATVVRGVELQVMPGEFVVFVGPSGCGKSTLLRMIAGLEPVTEGEIAIDGQPVNHLPPAQRGIAMVFQSYALYPHMSAYKNMAFGLETAGAPKAVVKERVTRAARILRIEDLLSRKPRHLSGGQRQRVAIGRAIVRDPKIFLFDEPLSNLDADLRVQMRVEIAKLHADLRATMIYVTHDQIEAMTMADKIVVLNDGSIEQVGAPLDVYNTPKNQFVAGFIGSPKMNFLKATVTAIHPSRVEVSVAGSPALTIAAMPERVARGSTLTLGVRPEHLSSGGGANDMSLTVSLAEQLGDKTLLYGSLPDGQSLVAQVPGQRAIRAGELVPIGVDPRFCHLFHADGNALSRITRS